MPDPQQFDINPGETKTIRFEINLKGKLYLLIETGHNRPGCLELWFVTHPFGGVKDIGQKCGRVEVELPGWLDAAVGSSLRAGAAQSPTKVLLTADVTVAHTMTIEW